MNLYASNIDLRNALRKWRNVLLQTLEGYRRDTLSLTAAGVAFYAFLSLFPAITALLSIYGLVANPTQVTDQLGSMPGALPSPAIQVIQKQMHSIAQGSNSTLGISLVVSIGVAIYSASKGARALISALNIAYGAVETRGFFKLTGIILLLTLASIILMIFLFFVIGLPGYLPLADLPAWLGTVISVICWLVVLVLISVALALIYALAPDHAQPRIQWITPGAVAATLAWLIASIAFSFYISHFSSYNKVYGSTAAIVILMLWFWVSALLTLLGAEINAALEKPGTQEQP